MTNYFGDESFQTINCAGTDNQVQKVTNYTKHTPRNQNNTQKHAQSNIDRKIKLQPSPGLLASYNIQPWNGVGHSILGHKTHTCYLLACSGPTRGMLRETNVLLYSKGKPPAIRVTCRNLIYRQSCYSSVKLFWLLYMTTRQLFVIYNSSYRNKQDYC